VSDVPRYDERRYVEIVVERTHVQAEYILPPKEAVLPLLPQLAWHQDEPFGSTSIFAQWCVFQAASRARVKVLLDGQGADEVFGGYHLFFGPKLASLVRAGRLREFAAEWRAMRARHGYARTVLAGKLFASLFPGYAMGVSRALGCGGGDLTWLNLERLGAERRDALHQSGARGGSLASVSASQLASTSLPMLLHWEDRSSMAHSVEARLPFLDPRLVERAMLLPDEMKVAGGVTKVALRQATAGLVPEAVRGRMDKIGFATAEREWFLERAGEFRSAFQEALAVTSGIFTDRALARFESVLAGRAAFSFWSWRIINFGAWWKRFTVRL
jgi:asparagine synthase (glutamine-hydrolysing)